MIIKQQVFNFRFQTMESRSVNEAPYVFQLRHYLKVFVQIQVVEVGSEFVFLYPNTNLKKVKKV